MWYDAVRFDAVDFDNELIVGGDTSEAWNWPTYRRKGPSGLREFTRTADQITGVRIQVHGEVHEKRPSGDEDYVPPSVWIENAGASRKLVVYVGFDLCFQSGSERHEISYTSISTNIPEPYRGRPEIFHKDEKNRWENADGTLFELDDDDPEYNMFEIEFGSGVPQVDGLEQ